MNETGTAGKNRLLSSQQTLYGTDILNPLSNKDKKNAPILKLQANPSYFQVDKKRGCCSRETEGQGKVPVNLLLWVVHRVLEVE